MKKWVIVGALAMLAAWLPFLYAELTSEEAEGKDRALPAVDGDDEPSEAVPVADEGEDDEPPAEPITEPDQPSCSPGG